MEKVPKKKDNTNCCVPHCRSKGSDRCFSFHKFPRNDSTITTTRFGCQEVVSRRDEWIRVLKIRKMVSNRMCVCSRHFLKKDYILPDVPRQRKHLKKTAIPSLNLPFSSTENVGVLGRKSEASVHVVTKRAKYHKNLSRERLCSQYSEDSQSSSGPNKSSGWTAAPHVLQIAGPQNKLSRSPAKDEKSDGPTSTKSDWISETAIFDGTGIKSPAVLKRRLILAWKVIREMELHISDLKMENRKLQNEKENPLIENVHNIKNNAVEGELSAIILLNKIATYVPES